MKSLFFKRVGFLSFLAASLFCVLERPADARQVCPLTFPPSPANDLTAYITIYPNINTHGGIQQQLESYFLVDVTSALDANPPIPYGLYPTWCVDQWDFISPTMGTVPGSVYSGVLYSTCDPNLNSYLTALGHVNTINIPAANWQMVNYILNNQTCNGTLFYWDVQAAINTLVGSGVGNNAYCGGILETPIPNGICGYPSYNQSVVTCLLTAATNAIATNWTPKCGDVYGALYVTEPTTDQILMLEVPITCPTVSIGTIGSCYSTVIAAEAAAMAATTVTGGCGGNVFTVSSSVGTCPATITVTVTDACGDTNSATCTAYVYTTPPTFSSVPPTTMNYDCYSQVPSPTPLTATDACGSSWSVIPTVNQTILGGSSCGDIITWVWTTTDCAGQPVTATEIITVQTPAPTVTAGIMPSNCFTSLAAADAEALAVTTGSAYCAGSPALTFTVSDNGQYCPATITVTGTDNCGLTSTVTYTVMIFTTPPVLIGVPASGASYQCLSQVLAEAVVTASVSCGPAPTPTLVSDVTNGPPCNCTITRTWSVTDCSGQSVTQSQTITVQDTTAPGATKGPINTCYTSAALADAAAVSATTFSATLCGGTVTKTFTDSGQTCPDTITVTGTDACGTSVSVNYTATILTAKPVLIGVPASGASSQCLSQVPAEAVVTASVACGPPPTPTLVSDVTNGPPCNCTITRTWSVTDCAGQTATQSQTIKVQDTTAPGATKGPINTCYTSAALADAAAVSATTFTSTLCGGTVTKTFTDSGQTCPDTITVTGTDACGTSVSLNYTATILTAKPTLSTPPANTTIPCGGQLPAPAKVTATDSCNDSLNVSYNQTETSSSSCMDVFTRTWSALDCAGQSNGCTQVITQYNNVAATLTCPTNITICTNICQMYCTFTASDWSGSCDGGSRYNNNWWQSWCGQNSPAQSWSSWTGWWGSCGANSEECNNWWNNWNNNHPVSCWGSWSGNQQGNQQGNWWNSWNNGNGGNQTWVPCAGNNPDTILNNCFKQVYPGGSVTIGLPGSGKCVTVNSCSAVQNCLKISGNPGCLNGSFNNPSSCNAGSFCAQVLALQLNCDFGDYGCVPGFVGKCGDLVLCDSTSPCNGKKVRDILSICNCALGGGSCPQGCTVQYLNTLCSNLNQCFEGCQVSSWCSSHLCSVYIPLPAQTGTATVAEGCGGTATLTYTDTVSTGSCAGTYVIDREWVAVDSCGNTDTCVQVITIITKCVTSQVCGSFNSQNPGGGYVWCNAHLNCNPGKACTIYCQNLSVTLTCNDNKTYTFPVPNCQVNFSQNCSGGSCAFNGTSWTTTLPCSGDNQIFLSGCGIPWQSDFANCKSVCWTGTFTCSTTGVNCGWQWGAACYNANLSNCGSVNVKPCQQTYCGYNNNDCAGTPENCKSSCQGGACGTGGNNYCGSWSSTGSCSF